MFDRRDQKIEQSLSESTEDVKTASLLANRQFVYNLKRSVACSMLSNSTHIRVEARAFDPERKALYTTIP